MQDYKKLENVSLNLHKEEFNRAVNLNIKSCNIKVQPNYIITHI
jgi:hypothetical protein